MFLHFNVLKYLLSIKTNCYKCAVLQSYQKQACSHFYHYLEQTSVQDSLFGTV